MEIVQNGANRSDILGAMASGLCAIHCALTPIIFAAKPVLEGTIGHHHHHHGDGFWGMLDYVFLALSLVAVWFSARHTRHRTFKWLLWVAWVVFAIGLLSEAFEIHWGIWLMYAGSIILVVTHIQNYRYSKKNKGGTS